MAVPSQEHAWADDQEFADDTDYASEFADPDDEETEGCEFPGNCCMPAFHLRSECHTPEMAEEWFKEAAA